MPRRIDPRFFNNLIDANALDVNADNPAAVVDELLGLAEEGAFTLMMPHSVRAEIEHPNTPAAVRRRAAGLIFTEPVQLTPQEHTLHQRVSEILQGEAAPGRHSQDAFHIVEAAKYGGYFITNDRRILSRKNELENLPGIAVVRPAEFLDIYNALEEGCPSGN